MRTVGALIYKNFELLDLFGPLEILGWLSSEFRLVIIGPERDPVLSNMGVATIADFALADHVEVDLLLVPGGWGRSTPVDTEALVPWLTTTSQKAENVMTVCTGSGLLALTGMLDGREATTNKALYQWVVSKRPTVNWRPHARWVKDGKFYTSSGVSAGLDMSLAVISDILGTQRAEEVALGCEYEWHRDPTWDPFATLHGLA